MICVVVGLTLFIASCSEEEPVAPDNNPPVLVDLQDTTTTVGSTLRLTAFATDRDGDQISYHLTVIIRGIHDPLPDASIDSSSGEFVFRPTASDRPSRDFVVRARDGHGGEDATEFTVTVN
jgi:hypothetical protein